MFLNRSLSLPKRKRKLWIAKHGEAAAARLDADLQLCYTQHLLNKKKNMKKQGDDEKTGDVSFDSVCDEHEDYLDELVEHLHAYLDLKKMQGSASLNLRGDEDDDIQCVKVFAKKPNEKVSKLRYLL